MSEPKYSIETVIQIWNDKTGERVEVGPDRDGLDLVQIRSYADNGTLERDITFTQEQAKLVAEAIQLIVAKESQKP